MAHKPSKKKLKCKITDIYQDPLHKGRMIVAVEFDDGDPAGPWHQGFSVVPEKIITLEEFMTQMYSQKIERPVDPYSNLRSVMEQGQEFVLDLTAKIEPDAQD